MGYTHCANVNRAEDESLSQIGVQEEDEIEDNIHIVLVWIEQ